MDTEVMSNIYFKADCDILTDHKLIMAGPEGFTMYMKGLAFAKLHLTDGAIPLAALPVVGIGIKNPKKVMDLLIQIGLWVKEPDGVSVGSEKWARHQTTKEQVDASKQANRERQRAFKERQKTPRQSVTETKSNSVSNALITPPENRVQRTEAEEDKRLVGNQELVETDRPTDLADSVTGFLLEIPACRRCVEAGTPTLDLICHVSEFIGENPDYPPDWWLSWAKFLRSDLPSRRAKFYGANSTNTVTPFRVLTEEWGRKPDLPEQIRPKETLEEATARRYQDALR